MNDGKQIEDEISVADAHPSGKRPFTRSNYIEKFNSLTNGTVDTKEAKRFIKDVENIRKLKFNELFKLNVEVRKKLTGKSKEKICIF